MRVLIPPATPRSHLITCYDVPLSPCPSPSCCSPLSSQFSWRSTLISLSPESHLSVFLPSSPCLDSNIQIFPYILFFLYSCPPFFTSSLQSRHCRLHFSSHIPPSGPAGATEAAQRSSVLSAADAAAADQQRAAAKPGCSATGNDARALPHSAPPPSVNLCLGLFRKLIYSCSH